MTKTLEKIIVLLTDFITINLAFIIFFKLRVESGWFRLLVAPEFFIPMFIIYFYWGIIFLFIGMYRTWFAASRFDEISTLFKASFFGIFILFIIIFIDDYLHGVASANRILIFIYWGLFLLMKSHSFKASFFGIFILFIIIFIDDYMHGVASANRILIFIYWGLFILLVGGGRLIIRSVQRNLLNKGNRQKECFDNWL